MSKSLFNRLLVNGLRLQVVLLFCLLASSSVSAQCADGSVCVSQTTIDRATAAVTELAAARQVIEAFGRERTANEQERAAAARLVDRLNNVIAVQDRLATEYDKVIVLYKAVIAEQAALIERLQKMLNAPKSAWQRFASALKTIGYILSGIALGRGL